MSVAVGIYVYNGMPYIKEAIQSIIEQTRKIDEIVISDNCSTDGTVEIVNKYISAYPDYNWKLNVNKINMGGLQNALIVLDKTESDFLLFLHADDILKPKSIAKQLSFILSNPELALVGGYDDSIDKNGNSIKEHVAIQDHIYKKGEIFEFIKSSNSYIPFSSVLHRTAVLRKIGFDDSVICDEIYWPTVLRQYPIAVLGEALTLKRFHKNNTTFTYSMNFKIAMKEIRKHLLVSEYEPARKKEIDKILRYKYANNSLGNVISLIKKKKVILAFKFIFLAMKLDLLIFFKRNCFYLYIVRIPSKIIKYFLSFLVF
jgi:glycosyltransferase involved in cell wall biosynthesis